MIKHYATYMTGALTMILAALILWACTRLSIEDVIAASLAAYVAGLIGARTVIDKLERRKLRRHAAQIVTLVQAEMDQRKEEAS